MKKLGDLIEQIEDRGALINEIADATKATKNNISTNWLSEYKGYPVPKKHQDRVVSVIEKRIKNQNINQESIS